MNKPSLAKKIRIVIVDDHPMWRRGVSETLSEEEDLELVGVGETADDAIRLASKKRPDLILLDIVLPGGGIEAAREIARSNPEVKVVMLTVREDQASVNAALKAGARGYLVKGVDAHELVSTLRKINAGQSYVMPSLAAHLLSAISKQSPTAAAQMPAGQSTRLTQREQQIVTLLSDGLTNQEIAERLALAENTIKHYMTPLLQKLGARNRTEAALIARSGSAVRRK